MAIEIVCMNLLACDPRKNDPGSYHFNTCLPEVWSVINYQRKRWNFSEASIGPYNIPMPILDLLMSTNHTNGHKVPSKVQIWKEKRRKFFCWKMLIRS